ncbi:MAG TPA: PorV/PorQ family protein [Saprospiraceae bacterium]|nr:PorV/PorQ family protein [Saprospiraceae bacterium]HRO08776.1 PorV/PorQ family protein [Saprospiraceae bacterium]HRP41641.1 PorV/PorQ family protein [Saprospiraceae bacterium]
MACKKWILITFCIGCFFSSNAQKFVNEFLNIGVGARAHGMSGSVTASVDDGTAGYWNPSGLIHVKSDLQINAMHANWFGGIANYDYVSIVKKMSGEQNHVAAFSFIRLGVDNIPNTLSLIGPDGTIDYDRVTNFSAADFAGIFSYARAVGMNQKLSLGGSVKVIHRSIGSFGKAWGFGADLSVLYKVTPSLTLGVAGKDITTTFNAWSFNLTDDEKKVFQSTDNDIPVSSTELTLPRLVLGIAYKIHNGNFSYLGELDANISTYGYKAAVISTNRFNIDPSFGLEIGYANKVFVRGGVGNLQSVINPVNTAQRKFELQPNVGLGLKLGRLKVDYALANVGSVSGVLVSHIFSLGLDFIVKE